MKAIYFSATGNTKRVIELFCKAFGEPAEYLDVTDNEEYGCEIDKNTLAVIGVPSFEEGFRLLPPKELKILGEIILLHLF